MDDILNHRNYPNNHLSLLYNIYKQNKITHTIYNIYLILTMTFIIPLELQIEESVCGTS